MSLELAQGRNSSCFVSHRHGINTLKLFEPRRECFRHDGFHIHLSTNENVLDLLYPLLVALSPTVG